MQRYCPTSWPARIFAHTSSSLVALSSPLYQGQWRTTRTSRAMLLMGAIDGMTLSQFSPKQSLTPGRADRGAMDSAVAGLLRGATHYLGGWQICRRGNL